VWTGFMDLRFTAAATITEEHRLKGFGNKVLS
jgi:hypothetical protein